MSKQIPLNCQQQFRVICYHKYSKNGEAIFSKNLNGFRLMLSLAPTDWGTIKSACIDYIERNK